MDKEILLAQPRGFCAGFNRAIEIVERTLAQFGAPIYVRHDIVHKAYVVNDLRNKDVIFIKELNEISSGNIVKWLGSSAQHFPKDKWIGNRVNALGVAHQS